MYILTLKGQDLPDINFGYAMETQDLHKLFDLLKAGIRAKVIRYGDPANDNVTQVQELKRDIYQDASITHVIAQVSAKLHGGEIRRAPTQAFPELLKKGLMYIQDKTKVSKYKGQVSRLQKAARGITDNKSADT